MINLPEITPGRRRFSRRFNPFNGLAARIHLARSSLQARPAGYVPLILAHGTVTGQAAARQDFGLITLQDFT